MKSLGSMVGRTIARKCCRVQEIETKNSRNTSVSDGTGYGQGPGDRVLCTTALLI